MYVQDLKGDNFLYFKDFPKRGFKNINRKEFAVVNLNDLNIFENGQVVTPNDLLGQNIIKKTLDGVKILANGTLEKQLTVKLIIFSSAAKEAIEKAGGTVEVI